MYKNAIVLLNRGYEYIYSYQNLINRNNNIYDKIISKTFIHFDIIIFHEGNILKEHQEYIQTNTPSLKLNFIDVTTTEPKTAFQLSKNKINLELCPPTLLASQFSTGYRHMCHFWSIDFLDYLKDYKYIVRIDEDCLVENFDLSVFEKMYKNNIFFVSPYFQGKDNENVTIGMEILWDRFIKENNITPFKYYHDMKCPYTNLMIVDIQNIRNNLIIKQFLKYIDDSHGIYSNRWGDLPIWGLILSTLIDPKHYSDFKTISYTHDTVHRINL